MNNLRHPPNGEELSLKIVSVVSSKDAASRVELTIQLDEQNNKKIEHEHHLALLRLAVKLVQQQNQQM